MRGLPELPPEAAGLLAELAAPPRLRAHLRLVYAVACDVTAWLQPSHPRVVFDREAFLSLDDFLQQVAAGADERPAYRNGFPV
ncbi:hypothetical protein [Actinoplanes sp. NPDC049802]|uniref:hypothetical protein n=1 Tax=Actinoplanes sp. NPDC049802 TaxID=3154742 RepID=UPI0033C4505C